MELTVALHFVFDTPAGELIWDVGHQSYPHKILTGRRYDADASAGGGLVRFDQRAESEYEPFGAAHPPLRFPPALRHRGCARSRRQENNVIAVIGDGAMSAGMAYEAMNNAGARNDRLIVILNDNDMSIAPPVGAMWAYLSRLLSGAHLSKLHDVGKQLTAHLPKRLDKFITRGVEHAADSGPVGRCSKSSACTSRPDRRS